MREFITLLEDKSKPQDIEIIPLNFTDSEVAPVLSKDTIELHYDKLAKGYAERYNKNEGDSVFNEAGVFLHNILFQQYQAPTNSNKPTGSILEFIIKHYKDFDTFKESFANEAMKIQGSGWIYLAKDGKIKTIVNHEIKKDIVLLIDWWEHAWALDYKHDKKKYLDNQWKIINWEKIDGILR